MPDRLLKAGYPARAVKNLDTMHGPGLDAARTVHASLRPDGIMALIGHRGPGKTQIGTYLAAQRILAGKTAGRYRKALDLWAEIKGTWRAGADKSEDEVIRPYRTTAFLVIDEAQERGDTDADRLWCDRMLVHIIDHRYDNMLPTLLIANLDLSGYEATVPASVRSRIREAGGVMECNWQSYR